MKVRDVVGRKEKEQSSLGYVYISYLVADGD